MSLVTLHGAGVSLDGRQVLAHVDLSVSSGEIVTVVGPNGSGKTTLMRVLVGAQALSSGSVERKPGLTVGYVPQRLNIDRTLPLTVGRFLELPRPQPGALDTLERVGAGGLAKREMTRLSGGQFQRVLLARALLGKPELLILDEPTTGLDQPGSASFYRLLEALRDDIGCAVFLVSHELHVVMAASDRVICLNGHVCCEGTPEHVASAPEYRALFGSGSQGALALYRHEHDHHHHHEAH